MPVDFIHSTIGMMFVAIWFLIGGIMVRDRH